jgi:hypothetical protein
MQIVSEAPLDPLVGLGYELLGSETWPHGQDWHPTLITERLWVGGVPDSDTMTVAHQARLGADWSPSAHLGEFDAVVTLSALNGPGGSGVLEMRAGLLEEGDPAAMRQLVLEAVAAAVRWHDQGYRVLIRCRAGLNRSGLVGTLTLMELTGTDFDTSLRMLRELRSMNVLNSGRLESIGRDYAGDETFWETVRKLSNRE